MSNLGMTCIKSQPMQAIDNQTFQRKINNVRADK